MKEYDIALKIAEKAHEGQKDLGDVDYIEHPLAVSRICRTEKAKTVALLHDVLEDTDITAEDLLAQGISADTVEVVKLLTKTPGYDKWKYFEDIKNNPVAKEVKMADLLNNMDPNRKVLPKNKEKVDRLRKHYHRRFLELYQS